MTKAFKKPVILQFNDSWAWKNLVRLDADDDVQVKRAELAAETLQKVSPNTKFRFVMQDGSQQWLTRLVAGVWMPYKTVE